MATFSAFLRRRRRLLLWLGGGVTVLAAIAVGLPFGVRFALAHWLRADGTQQARIERVSIDYLAPSIEIRGIEVANKTGAVLRLGRLDLALDLPGLWHRRLHARALTVDHGMIELVRSENGEVRVAGIPPGSESADRPAGKPVEASPWLIGIDRTAIDGLEIRIHTPQGSQAFTIENARLGAVAMWAGNAPMALKLAVAIGNGNMDVGGEATPLGSAPSVAIDLDVKSFDLARAALVPGLENLAGLFAGKLKLKAEFPRDRGPEIHLAGTASLERAKLTKAPDAPSLAALAWTGEASLGANAKGALTGRLQGKLSIEKLAAGATTLASISVSDLDARATYDATSGIDANATGALETSGLAVALGDAEGSADKLRWNGAIHATSAPGGKLQVETKGRLDAAAADYTSAAAHGRSDRLRWEGSLRASASNGGYEAEAKGDFMADAPSYAAPGASPDRRTEASLTRIAYRGLDAKIAAPSGGPMRIELGGALDASGIKAGIGGDSFADDALTWSGSVAVTAKPGGAPEVALDGSMDGKGIAADIGSLGYKATQQEIHWQGSARVGGDAPTMTASVRSTGTIVDAANPALRLLDIGQLSLDGLLLNPDGLVAVKRIEAGSFRAFGRNGANAPSDFVADVGTLAAENVGFEPGERIAARRVRIGNADIALERDKDGKLRLTGFLAALGSANKEKTSGITPRIVVGDLTLDGKSRIQFTDRSVDPPAKVALGPVTLHFGDLDSAEPDRPVPVDLKAELGRYSRLDLKGSAKPFTKRVNLDVRGKLTGFELTSLSGYLSQYLGYNLSRGRLDTEVHVKIVDGELNSESQLTITNLSVTQQQSEASRALQKNLEISLDTALSLLRDSDDVIHLNVPVTGDIANPNFDLSDAINTAIGNAMKRTVTTLLTVAFPVGGLIVAIVDSSGDKGLKFRPIAFQGGEVDLDSKAKDYLDTLSKLLKARPGVKITACGVSTQRDAQDIYRVRKEKAAALTKERSKQGDILPKEEPVPVTRDDLYDLSHRRSEAVRDYLVGQKGVDDSRVFICAPNVSDDPGAAPHADITL